MYDNFNEEMYYDIKIEATYMRLFLGQSKTNIHIQIRPVDLYYQLNLDLCLVKITGIYI